jgi:hypothetical protein
MGKVCLRTRTKYGQLLHFSAKAFRLELPEGFCFVLLQLVAGARDVLKIPSIPFRVAIVRPVAA